MLLHFALVLHFAAIITFCGVTGALKALSTANVKLLFHAVATKISQNDAQMNSKSTTYRYVCVIVM